MQKKVKKSSSKNTSILKKLFSKKELVRFGLILSLTANLVFIGVIVVATIQDHRGEVTNLTEGYLDSTCSNYSTKERAQIGSATKVNGVSFVPIYLTPSEQKNKSNNLALQYSFIFKTLLEINNPAVSNYYAKTTKLDTGYIASHPDSVYLPIYYNSITRQPINTDTQDLVD